MSDSNNAWGEAADDLRNELDRYDALPEASACEPLDNFIEAKHLTRASLLRVGVRWSPPFTLVYIGPGYIKFRNLSTGKKLNHIEFNDFSKLRIIHAGRENAETLLIAEGETDAAWLSDHYPGADVAILPSGSQSFQPGHVSQVVSYKQVIIMTDPDRAGDAGAKRIQDLVPHAQILQPANGDWCETNEVAPLPEPQQRPRMFVTTRELRELDAPDILSYYEQAILPIGGHMIIHGWAKSFKSYMAFDMCALLAQGLPWCEFEFTGGEPVRAGIVQYEIPFAYYQQRIAQLHSHSDRSELLDENLVHFTPLSYPQLRAGDKRQQEALLRELDYSEVQVLLIDPIRRTLSGADLNSEKDVSLLRELVEAIQSTGVSVVLTHHDNKNYSRMGGGDPLGMTGTGAFAGDADSIISVSIPKGLTVKEPYRNIDFTLRNAPSPDTRSVRFDEQELLIYSREAVQVVEGDADISPPPDEEPAI